MVFRKEYNIKIILLFILNITGLLITLYATWDSISIRNSLIYKPLIFDILPFTKCININASAFSYLKSIPIVWIIFLIYWWICISLIIKRNIEKKEFHISIFLLTSIVFFISLYLNIIQIKLKIVCLYCFANSIINLILLRLCYLNLKKINAKINLKVIGKYLISSTLLLGTGILFFVVFTNQLNNKNIRSDNPKIIDTINVIDIVKAHFKTDKPIKITVVIDYSCPYCKYLTINLPNLIIDYQENVEIVYIQVPLSTSLQARAAILANEYDEFDYFHNKMFINQGFVDSTFIMDLARKRKINTEIFSLRLNSIKILNELSDNIETAKKLNFIGLPTLFINNNFIELWHSPYQIKYFINFELDKLNLKK
jgi:protein-disulfide isomerase